MKEISYQIMRQLLLSLFIATLSFSTFAQNNCPEWKWAEDLELSSTTHIIKAVSDSIGNIFVLGHFYNSEYVGFDTITTTEINGGFFVAKYDTNRFWAWATSFEARPNGGVITNSFEYGDIFINDLGQLFVSGTFHSLARFDNISVPIYDTLKQHAYVAKLDTSSKQWVWVTSAGGNSWLTSTSLAGDQNGNTYITGLFNHFHTPSAKAYFDSDTLRTDTACSFIAKVSSGGTWQWVKKAGYIGLSPQVAVDFSGNPTIAASFSDSLIFNGSSVTAPLNGYDHLFIIKFNPLGQAQSLIITENKAQLSTGPSVQTLDADYDNSGNLHLYGKLYNGSFEFGLDTLSGWQDFFQAKLNSSNQWVWANKIGSELGVGAIPGIRGMACANDGSTYFSGRLSSFAQGKLGNDSLNAEGVGSVWLGKMSPSGQWLWAGAVNAKNPFHSGSGSSAKVSITKRGYGFLYGKQNSELIFGTHPLYFNGSYLAKFGPKSLISIIPPNDTLLYCGESYELGARSNSVSQVYYRWYPGAGLSDSTIRNPVARPDTTTLYQVTGTTSTGCSASTQVKVSRDSSVNFTGGINFLTITLSTQFCDNQNMGIYTSIDYDGYFWANGDTTDTIYPTRPGYYALTVLDTQGCYFSDSILLTPPARVANGNRLLCKNDSVLLRVNGSNLDSLKWSTGSHQNTIYAKQPGKYWVTVQKGTCQYTDTVEVLPFSDTANASFTYTQNGFTLNFQPNSIGVIKGVWYFGDGSFSNSITATHTYANTGRYEVCFEATDVCGYKATECDSIDVNFIDLEEAKPLPAFSIFPNPTEGKVYIQSSSVANPNLVLSDMAGKILLDKSLHHGHEWSIDLQHLSKGTYFIRLNNAVYRLMKL